MVLQIDVLGAWKILQENTDSILVDVRTKAEIDFVGVANLSQIGAKSILLPWKDYPQMNVDESFTDKLSSLIINFFPNNPKDINLLFLCRTGSRSLEASMFMFDMGYKNCYNIINGFEGSQNDLGQRGKINGWKASDLPWRQN
jgi:rhodanese-related sulfurtransferase